jgi:hypothetical protein
MKSRHMKSVIVHYPGFVARNWLRMMRHTFRGSTWKTWLRLEDEHDAFVRYKAIRRREREYFPEDSASGSTTGARVQRAGSVA